MNAKTPNKKSDMRMSLEYSKTKDPATGIISKIKLVRAHEDAKNKKNRNIVAGGISTLNFSATLLPTLNLSWTERGPYTDVTGPSNGNTRGSDFLTASTAGRVRAIWPDLADATGKTVWAAGVDGGLWKTTDITVSPANWVPVDDDQFDNLAITSIAQDPTNTNVLYAATGESFMGNGGGAPSANAVKGVGVFKSTDHGVTWSLLSSTSTSIFSYITKIICGSNGYVYLATTRTDDDVSTATGINNRGHLRRSADGGATWTIITPLTALQGFAYYGISDIEMSSTGRLHVASGMMGGPQYYAYTDAPTTATASTAWSTAVTPFPNYTTSTDYQFRVELAVNGNTLYALPVKASTLNADVIYKSTDGGANWSATAGQIPSASPLTNGQAYYDLAVAINPSNANECIVGGLDNWKTTDGGATWTKISTWVGQTGQYSHADMHNLTWYDSGNKLLFGNDGGVFYSGDKGATIKDRNNGLRIKQFYSTAIHPTATNYFLAGAQDNGTHQINAAGLASSIEVLGGDGGFVAIDQTDPSYQFGTYVYGAFRRSTNGGANWSSVNFNLGTSSAAPVNMGQFINAYALDDSSETIYAGAAAGSFFRWTTATTTAAGTYYLGGTPPTGASIVSGITSFGGGQASAVKISPYTLNRVFFGTTAGKIVRIDNAHTAGNNPTTVNITPSAMSTIAAYTSSINIGTTDNNIIACYSNYGISNIWVSTDAGASWTTIDGNLADMPVRWAMFYPGDNNKAIIATETGVWITDLINGTSTVWTSNTSFPSVRTDMLAYRPLDRTVVAATHGRGLFSTTLPDLSCTPASSTISAASSTVCSGSGTTLSLSTAYNELAYTFQWSSSTTSGGIFSNLLTASTQATGNLTATTYYKCTITCIASGITYTTAEQAVTVNPSLPASVSISSSDADNIICIGTSVTFTATPTNGGASPSYQWKLNGTNVGTNIATYTNASLANGDIVTVVMTSNATPCLTGSPATTSGITTTVNANLPASVSIASSDVDNIICIGTSVTFTATPTNGGVTPSYQWKLNGTNVGTNIATYTNASLANGDIVTVVMTSNATPCLTGSPATSSGIITTVNANLLASVSIASSDVDNIVCIGTSVTFTATPTNGGVTPSYQWKLNGTNVGTNIATYTNASIANGDIVTVVMTSNATPCLTGSPATSSGITTTVNANLPASVSISSNDADNIICAGTSVTFTATPTNGGASPSYQWKLNGTNVGTNIATYTNASLANGDIVTVVMTSNATPCLTGSPATSSGITTTVNTNLPATVTIASSDADNIICAGTNVTFTATPTNGGSSPSYQWKLNGTNVGTNIATYTNASLANGDIVTVVMTSNASCVTGSPATSSGITTTVNTNLPASVSISSNDADNIICAGTSVTFTATPTNGGVTPSYQWKLNGTNVGTNIATYTNASLASGSIVTVVMTSNASCVTGSPATSSGITTTVNANLTASVSISSSDDDNVICEGSSVTFTAIPTNGGAIPSFQWKLNGTDAGTNIASYTNASLANGDIVTVVMTPDAAFCSINTSATAIPITTSVTPTTSPSVTIESSSTTGTTYCLGSDITFHATTTNAENPTFQWKVNDIDVQGYDDYYYSSSLSNLDKVTVVMTVTNTCVLNSVVSDNMTVEIKEVGFADVMIMGTVATGDLICSSNYESFTAFPYNGGDNPTFKWKLNGVVVEQNSSFYANATWTNNDELTVEMTSNAVCLSNPIVTSPLITISVNPTLFAEVSISSNAINNTICAGTPVIFTANPTNGGLSPSYQWKLNGFDDGTNSNTYTNPSLSNGDIVTVEMTSNATPCLSGSPALAIGISTTVNNCNQTRSAVLSLQVGDETICNGELAHLIITASGTGLFSGMINGTIPFESYESPINVPVEPGETTTYTITAISDATGPIDAGQISGQVQVVVNDCNQTRSAVLTLQAGDETICNGDIAHLSIAVTGTGPWSGTLSNGQTFSGNASPILISAEPFQTTTFTIAEISDANGLLDATQITGSATVSVNPALSPIIIANGPTTLCEGQSVELSVSLDNKRFATSVVSVSSEYNECGFDYSSCQILGQPNTYPSYGDLATAWSPFTMDSQREFIELRFAVDKAAPINFIDIYETFGAGSIDGVFVKNPNTGLFERVYEATAGFIGNVSRILHIPFNTTAFNVSEIRIEMNSPAVEGYNEIDAVAIGLSSNNVSYSWSNGTTTGLSLNPSIIVNQSGNYTVSITNNGCTETSLEKVVTVNTRPTAVLTLVGNDKICTGSETTLRIDITGENTGLWSGTLSDGTPFEGATSPIMVKVSPSSSIDYSIATLTGGICETVNLSGIASITVNEIPSAEISGTASICQGSTTDLTITIFGDGTGPWSGTITGGIPFSSDLQTITIPVSPTINTIYSITSFKGLNCTSTNFSGSAEITVTTRPTAVLGGSGNLCAGSSKELSIAVTGEGTGPWNGELSDGTIFEGVGSPIMISINPLITTPYTIKSLSKGGCDANPSDLSGEAVVTVREVPSAVISGDADICAGTQTELTITITGDGTGPWFGAISDGINSIGFSGSENVIKVPVTPDGSKTYYIESFSGEYCESNDFSGIATVNILEKPSATLSGNATICKGSEATLTIDIIGEGTGPWLGTLSDGTTFSSAGNPIEVIVKPTVSRSYTITSLEGAFCIASDLSGTVTVTVNELPTASISYASPLCAKGVATVSQTGQADGLYSSAVGLDIDPNTGEINLETSTPGEYTVKYAFAAGICENVTTTSVVILPLPTASISYLSNPYCARGFAIVSQQGQVGGLYSSSQGLVIDQNTGEINLATSTPGEYTVKYSFAAGICENEATATVAILPLPTASITYGLDPYCARGLAMVTQEGTVGGLYSSTLGLVIDQNTGDINLATSTPGEYVVTYRFSEFICENETTATVVILPLPTASITYSLEPYCAKGLAMVNREGQIGGSYSSTFGLDINPTNGEINLESSIPGEYVVTYRFSNIVVRDKFLNKGGF